MARADSRIDDTAKQQALQRVGSRFDDRGVAPPETFSHCVIASC
jgi:hypothetical protein